MNKNISGSILGICLAFSLLLFSSFSSAKENQASEKKITIAIIAFKNLMQKSELDWMCEGFAETMTTKLNYVKGFNLVERAQLKEVLQEMSLSMTGVTEGNAIDVGKILSADYLVIGSFQKLDIGNKSTLNINARLVNVVTSVIEHGKAVSAKGPFETVFEIQETIAAKLVSNMGVGVSDEEIKNMTINETKSVAAYELYNQAKNETDQDRQVKLLMRALEYDPDYAKVHLMLGSYFNAKSIFDSSVESLALLHLNKALALDAALTAAHYALGDYYYNKSRQYRESKDSQEDEAIKSALNHFELFVESKKNSKAKYYIWKVKKARKKIKKLAL